ncbi:tetratricopeptide repeat protein [Aquimarina sp. 2-A2]|uniref:tetratricopeptide repeat protein n=1 Tax=Aquimarina sp. 2-A2 TaxID=3382644 RepID=UPI00387F09C1
MKFRYKILRLKKWFKINNILPSLRIINKQTWKIVRKLAALTTLISGIITINIFLKCSDSSTLETNNTNQNSLFQPIFSEVDQTSFNILIIPFENYLNKEEDNCIGRAIQESIGVIEANNNFKLRIKAKSVDSISPPKNIFEVEKIQQNHNTDLIIYGLAKNGLGKCRNIEINLRYYINKKIVSKVSPVINMNVFRHDSDYILTNPQDIEKGKLRIDAVSFKFWLTALVDMKLDNPEKAFLELASISRDSSKISEYELSKKFRTIGNTYSDLNQHNRAIKAYDKAIKLNPLDTILYNSRGLALKKLKKYKEAIYNFESVIELDSMNDAAIYNLGSVYSILKKNSLAINSFTKAIEINPKKEDYHIYSGLVSGETNNHSEAIKSYSIALTINKNDTIAYNNRGVAYKQIGKFNLAMADYNKALSLDSTLISAYNNRGIIYKKLKKYDQALHDYTKAINLNENNVVNAYFNRGVLYSIIGKYRLALRDLNTYLSKNKSDYDSYHQRGIVFRELGMLRLAIEDFEKATLLKENSPEVLINKAKTFLILDNYNAAVLDLNKYLSLDPTNRKAFFLKAWSYSRLKNYKKAIENYKKAIDLDPQFQLAYNNIASNYLKLENYEEALLNYKKSIGLQPYQTASYLGFIYVFLFKKYWIIFSLMIFVLVLRKKMIFIYNLLKN